MSLRIGIDIGSTTVKVVVLDEQNKLLFRSYERHYSKARERAAETLRSIQDKLTGQQVRMVITGSAGLGVAKAADIDFVQEVYATAAAVNTYIPGHRRGHRAGRRGRQDHLLRRRPGGADERLLRRRHRRLHRPDGHPDERHGERAGRAVPEAREDLPHRLPLRRVRQERHPAHPQPGRPEGGRGRLHLPGGGGPDRGRPHPGPGAQGQDRLPGRPPPLPHGPAAAVRGDPEAGRGARHLPRGRGLLRRHRRGPVRLRLRRAPL